MDYLQQLAKELRANMTDAERKLWRHLRAHRCNGHKFRRQQPVGRYIVDFVHCHSRVIVELDGSQHLESEYDQQRDAWLAEQGYQVLRFWNNEVLQNTEGVLAVILEAVSTPSPQPLSREGRGANMPE